MPRLVRSVSLVCLVASFIALPSLEASPRERERPAQLAAAAAQALARWWSWAVPGRPGKAGTIIDPHGQCATGPSPTCGQEPTGEAGTIIDPSGGRP